MSRFFNLNSQSEKIHIENEIFVNDFSTTILRNTKRKVKSIRKNSIFHQNY